MQNLRMIGQPPNRFTTIEDPRGFLLATAPATATFAFLLASLDALGDLTRPRSGLRVLLDLSSIKQRPGLVQQAIVGEHVAQQLAHAAKVASLIAEGTETGFTERAARCRHLNLRVFTSDQEAVEWVIS